MFAPTSSRPLSGKGTGAHDYVPEQDKHLPSREEMPTEKDKTAADVEGSAKRDNGTHTASINSRQGSARPAIKKSSLGSSERRTFEESADIGGSQNDDGHPHLLHGHEFTSEPKSLNQPGSRGARELEGSEGHHTVEGHELKGNGVYGHDDSASEAHGGPGQARGKSAASTPPVTQRVKGRAEVLVGKVTRNMEMLDRGLSRQRQVPAASADKSAQANETASRFDGTTIGTPPRVRC